MDMEGIVCPQCGNEKIAKANVPAPLPNCYCAKCDFEWYEKSKPEGGK